MDDAWKKFEESGKIEYYLNYRGSTNVRKDEDDAEDDGRAGAARDKNGRSGPDPVHSDT